jgi:hypothetical protein
MADEKPGLHIDTDWKKQAQEEKRRLAEEQAARAKEKALAPAMGLPSSAGVSGAVPASARGAAGPAGASAQRAAPAANFKALVQSVLTQVFYYLGELGSGAVNLDMAKYQVDVLGLLEAKTANNLDEDERLTLDSALYEARTRFVGVASQYI